MKEYVINPTGFDHWTDGRGRNVGRVGAVLSPPFHFYLRSPPSPNRTHPSVPPSRGSLDSEFLISRQRQRGSPFRMKITARSYQQRERVQYITDQWGPKSLDNIKSPIAHRLDGVSILRRINRRNCVDTNTADMLAHASIERVWRRIFFPRYNIHYNND